MIASLRGRILSSTEDSLVVETNGVGFRVRMPAPEVQQAGCAGTEVQVFTHLLVRENDLSLYGFLTPESLDGFELLLTVPGIGPKAALSLLANLSAEALRNSIAQEDLATLTSVPGIGQKTARNLVFHLRDKIGTAPSPAGIPSLAAVDADVIAALTSLGYSMMEAQRAVQTLPRDVTSLEERIRLALAACGAR